MSTVATRITGHDTLPAVALTAYVGAADRTRALAAGYDEHVEKPVDASVLIAAIAGMRNSPTSD